MSERLEFLKRKHKGIQKIGSYQNVLINSGLEKTELEYLDLLDSDKVIEKVKDRFGKVERETELINSDCIFIDSKLMRDIYLSLNENSKCYIYTDDFQYCGLFIGNAKRCFEHALDVAKSDYQHTCFLLDVNFKYSFLINYYDESHNDEPNTYDIQLWKSRA